jgi:hypothetical protein
VAKNVALSTTKVTPSVEAVAVIGWREKVEKLVPARPEMS